MAKQTYSDAIDKLADAELERWFVWDLLATTALEKAGYDRLVAIRLLAEAIAALSSHDATDFPKSAEFPQPQACLDHFESHPRGWSNP